MFIDQDTKLRVNINYAYKGFSKLDTPEIRAAAGVIEIAEPVPPADYSEDTYYRTEQDAAPYVVYTRKSDEQIAAVMQAKAKAQRAAAVEGIKVTTQAGNEYDGDEVSQGRMARAIIALQATGTPTVKWVLANNVPTDVPVADIVEALALAGGAQAAIWSEPYEPAPASEPTPEPVPE